MYSEARRYRDEQVGDRWKKFDKYFRGGQSRFTSSVKDDDKWKADTKTNHIYAFIQSMHAALMRDLPIIDPSARMQQVQHLEEILKDCIRGEMLRNEFPERSEEMLMSGSGYGRAAIKTYWDKRKNGGVGGICIDVVSAKNLDMQPGKTRFRDCAYLFETQMMDRVTLLLMYPDRRDEILKLFKPGERTSSLYAEAGEAMMEGTHTDGSGLSLYYPMLGAADPQERLPVVECWMIDPETIEKYGWVVEQSGGKLKAVQRKRNYKVYPTGRYIRFCGNLVFEDRPNPFHRFPYSEYVNMSMDDTPWPMGEADQLFAIQDVYDTARNQLVDAVNVAIAGAKTIVGPTANLKKPLTNRPGEVVLTQDLEAIKQLEGSRVPGEAFSQLELIQKDFDRVSGYPDIITGGQIGDLRSGAAVETMNELVRGRLKLKTYSMECCYRDMACNMTDLIGIYYIRGIHYPAEYDLKGIRADWFEYAVRAGLNLPASRQTQQQFLLSLFDRAAATNPQLANGMLKFIVEQSDLTNKEELLNVITAAPPPPTETPNLSVVGGNNVPA